MQQGLLMKTSSSSPSPSPPSSLEVGFDHHSSDRLLQQFLNISSCTWSPPPSESLDHPSFHHFDDDSSSFNKLNHHHHHQIISPAADLLPLNNHASHNNHLIDASLLNNAFTTGSLNGHHFHHQGVSSIPNFGGATTNNNNNNNNNLNLAANGTTPGGGAASQQQPRQRIRARRGQATDPHSIAERLRRERIAERMKALQVLVPNANKTDKASMLDEIIDYVKFLQLQVKVLSMSRLGGAPPVSPLERAAHQPTSTNDNNNNMTVTEHQVAKLMEEDMGSAMQYLQGKGLCLMPISLATAISTATSHSRNPFPNKNQTNGEGPSSPNISALTIQSAAIGNNACIDVVKDTNFVSKT